MTTVSWLDDDDATILIDAKILLQVDYAKAFEKT